MNLLTQGLSAQQLQVNANQLTDEDVAAIKGAGLRLVHRPDHKHSNVVTLWDEAERRRLQMCVSPEAA